MPHWINRPAFHVLAILILGLLCYANTLDVPFYLDDVQNIIENPIVRDLGYFLDTDRARAHNAPTAYPLLMRRYIGSLSFALNYKLHGLEVRGYHIANLAIHLLNAVLVYWLVRLLFATLPAARQEGRPLAGQAGAAALVAALLFVAHPIQTQAVTYIVQRFTSLAATFCLLSLALYIRYRLASGASGGGQRIRAAGPLCYVLSLASAVAAMKTKEIAFTLPVMILACELIFFSGGWKRFVPVLPFLLTMLIIPLTLMGLEKVDGDLVGTVSTASKLQTDMARSDYLFTQFRVIITYLRLILLPIGQNIDYDYPVYRSFFVPAVFFSWAALLAFFGSVAYVYYRCRKSVPAVKVLFFGCVWLFVTLSVESSVFPIADVIFEHRMYMPAFGLFLMPGVLLSMVNASALGNPVKGAAAGAVVVAVLAFAVAAHSRNGVWNDPVRFWQDVVDKSPGKARPHNYLGLALYEQGDLENAIIHYRAAAALLPRYANAYSNLGKAYFESGDADRAIWAFQQALAVNPGHSQARYNLGLAYGKKGLKKLAYEEMKKSGML